MLIGIALTYLGIAKKWEPPLLVPIGFSIIFLGLMSASLDIEAPVSGKVTYLVPLKKGEVITGRKGETLFPIRNLRFEAGNKIYAHDRMATLEEVSILVKGSYSTGLLSHMALCGSLYHL